MARSGSPANDYALRVLSPGDVARVAALHGEIQRSLPDNSFLYAQSAEFFARLINEEGVVVGAFCAEQLVAYGAVILPQAHVLRRHYDIGHLVIDSSAVAFGAGCGVKADHRRAGLFSRLIEERTRQAHLRGCSHVTGVVSPRNDASLRAVHLLGHAVVGIHHDQDGENFLLLTSAAARFPIPAAPAVTVPLADAEANLRVLRSGPAVGLPLHRNGEPVYAYFPPDMLSSGRAAPE
jgi:GNAT superfamily N-acetyltransferase